MIGKWIGIIDGTNKGVLVLNLSEKEGKTKGMVFVYDICHQDLNAEIDVEILGNKLKGTTHEFKPKADGNPTKATFEGSLFENGLEIKGTWKTDIETKGNFQVFKEKEATLQPPVPTALINKVVNLPACKLDVKGLVGLLILMHRDINFSAQPVFTVNSRESTLLKVGVEAFIKDNDMPKVIQDMSISINESNTGKGFRVVTISFKPKGENTITVTGDNPTWVNGRATEIVDYIKRFKNQSSFIFGKLGPIVNSLVFLFVLISLPSIQSILGRGILMAITVILLLVLSKLYIRWFPKAVIYLGEKEISFWQRNKDTVMATIITSLISAVIAFVATYFVNHGSEILSFFRIR